MSHTFHDIEKSIIRVLRKAPGSTPDQLGHDTGLGADQVRRGIQWLRLKGVVEVDESTSVVISLGRNGTAALKNGMPERRLLDMIRGRSRTVESLRKELGGDFGPALGTARKNGWIRMRGTSITMATYPPPTPEEKLITLVGKNGIPLDRVTEAGACRVLEARPDYIVRRTMKSQRFSLTDMAKDIDLSLTGIDVTAEAPPSFAARRHPLKEVIREIREIFVTLGFSEISGSLSQPGFWNFDALFTPQDHPAREMHDTFYIDAAPATRVATPDQMARVSDAHRDGWRYPWSRAEAKRMVLRTHTTCVTIRHLADKKPPEARLFSLGRVFRNEKASPHHLAEFHQVEGVVAGRDTTLRDLMGIQKEFYRRIGITRVKFWPTFFPYTEPSLQTMVYNERHEKWVELFGMGIFRPEVTEPLGIAGPVLAWGGGIERIAMLKYGIDDVRQLYSNDMGWLREALPCP